MNKEILEESYDDPDHISNTFKDELMLIIAKKPKTKSDCRNDRLCFLVVEDEWTEEWVCLSSECVDFFNDKMEQVMNQGIIERLMAGVYEEKL